MYVFQTVGVVFTFAITMAKAEDKTANNQLADPGTSEMCVDLQDPLNRFGLAEDDQEFYQVPDRPVYVFSAYYDDRTSIGGPLVRIMAMGLQRLFHTIESFYCVLSFRGLQHPVSVEAQYEVIYPSTLWSKEYTAHWILCPISDQLIQKKGVPVSLTVLPEACDPTPTFVLPVQAKKPPKEQEKSQDKQAKESKLKKNKRKQVALCLPSLYKLKEDWISLAEWIFLHKYLGYSTVYVYITSGYTKENNIPADRMLSLLSQKWDKGVEVRLVKMFYPKNVDVFYYNQHVAINDCLYRAGLEHEYATVSDKDEIVKPYTYPDMLAFLDANQGNNIASYAFQHILIGLSKEEKLSVFDIERLVKMDLKILQHFPAEILNFVTLNYKWRMKEPYPPGEIRSKTVYNLALTISADIHYHRKIVPGSKGMVIPPQEGAVYHFQPPYTKKWLEREFIHGTGLDMYASNLIRDMIALLELVHGSLDLENIVPRPGSSPHMNNKNRNKVPKN